MDSIRFSLPLRRTRDLLLARYRARQLAGLLGYGPLEQARIAAAVFEIAAFARQRADEPVVQFQVGDDGYRVSTSVGGAPQFREPLPSEVRLSREDAGWAFRQMIRLAPFRALAEIERQNRELQALLRAHRPARARDQAA